METGRLCIGHLARVKQQNEIGVCKIVRWEISATRQWTSRAALSRRQRRLHVQSLCFTGKTWGDIL